MRTVVYDKTFDAALEAIEPSFERADEFLRGTEWLLARNPEYGTLVNPADKLWMMPTADVFPDAYVVWYTFDSAKVYMLSISRSPASAADSE